MIVEKTKQSSLINRIKNTYQNFKCLYRDDRMAFYIVTTKAFLSYLFFANLFRAFFTLSVLGAPVPYTVMSLKAVFAILIIGIFTITTLTYIFFGYERKYKTANLIFMIQTILAIVNLLFFLLLFYGNSGGILSWGFFLYLILIPSLIILTWQEKLFVKIFGSIFKKELLSIGQVDDVSHVKTKEKSKVTPEVKPEPVKEPEPVVEPEVVPEPEPVKEPEPVVEPEVVPEPEPIVEPEATPEPEPEAVPEPEEIKPE